jgi:hypothetical protein
MALLRGGGGGRGGLLAHSLLAAVCSVACSSGWRSRPPPWWTTVDSLARSHDSYIALRACCGLRRRPPLAQCSTLGGFVADRCMRRPLHQFYNRSSSLDRFGIAEAGNLSRFGRALRDPSRPSCRFVVRARSAWASFKGSRVLFGSLWWSCPHRTAMRESRVSALVMDCVSRPLSL